MPKRPRNSADCAILPQSIGSPSPLAARASSLGNDVLSPTPASAATKLSQLSLAADDADEQSEDDEDGSDVDTEVDLIADASNDSIEVPLQDEGDDSFDQSFDDDEDEEGLESDEEYEPDAERVKPVSASKKGSASKPKKTLPPLPDENFGTDMEVPLKGGESDEEEGGDDYALDKSMVIRTGSIKSKKPKRCIPSTLSLSRLAG